jgi:hypothetical protein
LKFLEVGRSILAAAPWGAENDETTLARHEAFSLLLNGSRSPNFSSVHLSGRAHHFLFVAVLIVGMNEKKFKRLRSPLRAALLGQTPSHEAIGFIWPLGKSGNAIAKSDRIPRSRNET